MISSFPVLLRFGAAGAWSFEASGGRRERERVRGK